MTYAQLMDERRPFITVTLDVADPIELGDFVGFFSAVSGEFERYMREHHPDAAPDARFYLKEVRKGSIIADIFPLWDTVVTLMDEAVIVATFAGYVAQVIRGYVRGEKQPGATKGAINDYLKTVRAIAKDSNGQAVIETARFMQGVWRREVVLTFNTKEARQAEETLEKHKHELDAMESADHSRVLMVFQRSDRGDADIGKRSGECSRHHSVMIRTSSSV